MKDRKTNEVAAKVVPDTRAGTLQGFAEERTGPETQVYADDAGAYAGIDRPHESVSHRSGEYARDEARINGMESFRSMSRRGHRGIHHRMSAKHLQRHSDGFAGRHDFREYGTLARMGAVFRGFEGKRLRYRDLTADNGLPSGARDQLAIYPRSRRTADPPRSGQRPPDSWPGTSGRLPEGACGFSGPACPPLRAGPSVLSDSLHPATGSSGLACHATVTHQWADNSGRWKENR